MADGIAVHPAAAPVPDRISSPLAETVVRSVAFKFAIHGANAVTGIVVARALDPAGRGEMAAMVIWPALLAGVSTLGLPSALVYHVRRDPDRASELTGWALVIGFGTGVMATILGWHLVPRWLGGYPSHIVLAAQYCLLATTVYSLTVVARAFWEARGRFDRSHLLQLSSPVLTIAALIPQAVLGTLTPRSAAATYVLAGLPTAAWALVSLARAATPALPRARHLGADLLHFGTRSYGVDLAAVLVLYLDQALVIGLLPPEAVGIYLVGLNLSRLVNAVQGSAALIAFPTLVGLARQELSVAIARAARLSALASCVLAVIIVAFGGTLVTWLYGASFGAASALLPILVCEVVMAGMAQVLLQGFLASGRPGVATLIQMSSLALSVPVFLVLVPTYGAMGAAAGLLISTALRLGFTVASYPAFLQVRLPRLWIGPGDVADLAAHWSALAQSLTQARPGGAR